MLISLYFCCITLLIVSMAIAETPSRPGCEKAPSKSVDDCCKIPKLLQDSIVKDCHSKSGPMDCKLECIMTSTGMMINGEPKLDVAKKMLSESVDVIWKPIIEKAVDTCYQQSNANLGLFDPNLPTPPPNPESMKCNAKAGKLIHCVHQQVFANCPTMNNEPECAETKSIVEKCPEFLTGKKPA